MHTSIRLPGQLITAQWLNENLGRRDLVILDANIPYSAEGPDETLGEGNWRAAHIPGSRYAYLKTKLSDRSSPFGFTYPGDAAFAEALQALGVGDDTTVVIYDDFYNMWATRIWWMLRAIGFEKAAVLDGGLSAWKSAGFELSNSLPPFDASSTPVTINPQRSFSDLSVIQSWVQTAVKSEPLVCALPEGYFTGAEKVGGRGGHIPGSVSLPATSLLDAEGRFLPADGLKKKLQPLLTGGSVQLYCGGGVSATVIAFALALIGWHDAYVYDGSLDEWNSDPSRPLVAGLSS